MREILKHSRSWSSPVDPWTLAFLFLILLYILPIWLFKYFPSQDGPSHVYNSFILRHYNDPDYRFSEFYEIRKSLIPNWVSHASMMLLMYLMPPLIAEKVLLTGYIILMAVSMVYLLNAVEGGRTPLVFIGFPFIYNYPLLMGFYNFSLSVALLMFVIGYWWKHFDAFGMKNMVVLGLLLVVLYFCHLLSLILALFSIVTIAILSLAPKFTRWRHTLLSLLCMVPSIGLILYYTMMRSTTRDPGIWTLGQLLDYFIRNGSLAYYNQSQIIIGEFSAGMFLALFFYTLIREHLFTREWRFGLKFHRKDFLLLLFIAFFVIYLKAPDNVSGGGFIKVRLGLLLFLIIIPWLSWDMPKLARVFTGAAFILLSVIYLAHASYYHKILSGDVGIYTSGYDAVERNKVTLSLAFKPYGRDSRIGVFTHSVGHYGYTTGCIELSNYEATTEYFPTFFKPDLHKPALRTIEDRPSQVDFAEYASDIDYIITWGLASGSDVEARILQYYDLSKQNGNLKIFKRKVPDISTKQ